MVHIFGIKSEFGHHLVQHVSVSLNKKNLSKISIHFQVYIRECFFVMNIIPI